MLLTPNQLLLLFCEAIVAGHYVAEEEFDGFAFIGADDGCDCKGERGSAYDAFFGSDCFGVALIALFVCRS